MKKVTKSLLVLLVVSGISVAAYAACTVIKSYDWIDAYGEPHTSTMSATHDTCPAAESMANGMAKQYIRNHYFDM